MFRPLLPRTATYAVALATLLAPLRAHADPDRELNAEWSLATTTSRTTYLGQDLSSFGVGPHLRASGSLMSFFSPTSRPRLLQDWCAFEFGTGVVTGHEAGAWIDFRIEIMPRLHLELGDGRFAYLRAGYSTLINFASNTGSFDYLVAAVGANLGSVTGEFGVGRDAATRPVRHYVLSLAYRAELSSFAPYVGVRVETFNSIGGMYTSDSLVNARLFLGYY